MPQRTMHTLFKDSLAGKVALVTGAGSGIGKAAAKLFAYAGARVAVLTRSKEEATATCEEIRQGHGDALGLIADVSRSADLAKGLQAIQESWGQLDIVVANAGVNGVWAPVEDLRDEEWDRVFAINVRGTFLTVRQTVPLLKVRGGAIAIVSSVNGTRTFGSAGASAYASTKAAQLAFGRMMALELAQHRIRVNTVCPGSIETRIDENTEHRNLSAIHQAAIFPGGTVPLTDGKPGTAGQVAELLWFLCSDLATHISGAEVFIDGAESLLKG